MSNSDPTDLKIQLEVIRERLKYAEEKSRQQEQMLAQAYKNVGQKEAELQQIRSEREDLKIKWEVLQRDFKHSQNSLLQATQANTKKKKTAQLLGFLASFTFLISSLLIEEQIRFQVKRVAKEIEQAQDTLEEKQAALETTKDVSADIDEVLHITSSNSRAALLLLSAKIEEHMRIRLQEIGVQSKTNYAPSRQAIGTAVREDRIPQETASALRDFLAVKNKVAHAAAFDVDEATILALVSIGIELLKIIAAKKRENTEVLSSDTA